jgi:phage protein D
MSWKTRWSISIGGQTVTDRFNPFVQDVEVSDKDGSEADTAEITLDDSSGRFTLPKAAGPVAITIDGVDVFRGTIDEIRSTGNRAAGRVLTISAKGFDGRGKAKAPLFFHHDNATLGEFLNEAGQRAGVGRITVDPEFAAIQRPYWSAQNESFLHLAERLAREHGATFKVAADGAVFARRGAGVTPRGRVLGSIDGVVDGNVTSWDISPYIGRPRGKKAKVRYVDRKSGKVESREVEIEAAEYSAADRASIERAIAATGKTPRALTAQELGTVQRGFEADADPAGAQQRAALDIARSALERLTSTPRSFTAYELAAFKRLFEASDDAVTRTYSDAEMAAIRGAFDAPGAILQETYSAADAPGAANAAKGKKTSSQRQSGEGSVELVLTPSARVEGTFALKGARPGVDGSYRIAGVTHKLSRSGGSTTSLELKQPGSGVGSDSRTTRDWEQYKRESRNAAESVRDQVDPAAPAF